MPKPQLTPEQLDALITFAKRNGRKWKSELNYCWMTGNYHAIDRNISGYLHQVRNQFGPSWLVNFRLPA